MGWKEAVLEHKSATVCVFVSVALLAGLFLNQAGGPIEDTQGIVENVNVLPGAYGNPDPIATVRTSQGLIQARVATSLRPQRGQTVRVLTYRRVVTGGRTYEVVDGKKSP
jgi:hypothetical protein